MRYRTGRDDLNIRFEQRLEEVVIGIVVDPAVDERIGRDNEFRPRR